MSRSLFILLFVLAGLTPGCLKDEDALDGMVHEGNNRLKRVLMYANIEALEPISIVREYEYDSLGRISRVSAPSYPDAETKGTDWYELYAYDEDGRLHERKNYTANRNAPSGFINLMNKHYLYSGSGNLEKEVIEYPEARLSEYTFYTYDHDRLAKAEKYGTAGTLDHYISYSCDHYGRVTGETTFTPSNEAVAFVWHTYSGGLRVRSNAYAIMGKTLTHMREIIMQYDAGNNLILLESNELSPMSSMSGYVLRYEYGED